MKRMTNEKNLKKWKNEEKMKIWKNEENEKMKKKEVKKKKWKNENEEKWKWEKKRGPSLQSAIAGVTVFVVQTEKCESRWANKQSGAW